MDRRCPLFPVARHCGSTEGNGQHNKSNLHGATANTQYAKCRKHTCKTRLQSSHWQAHSDFNSFLLLSGGTWREDFSPTLSTAENSGLEPSASLCCRSALPCSHLLNTTCGHNSRRPSRVSFLLKLVACKLNSSPSRAAQLSRSAFSWTEFFTSSGDFTPSPVLGEEQQWDSAVSLATHTDQSDNNMVSDSAKICINASVCEYLYLYGYFKAFWKIIWHPLKCWGSFGLMGGPNTRTDHWSSFTSSRQFHFESWGGKNVFIIYTFLWL